MDAVRRWCNGQSPARVRGRSLMIRLNSDAIEYMNRLGFRDIVLDAIKYTT